MATATLLNPSNTYHHHSPFTSGYSQHATAGRSPSMSVPGMITPAESRRTSDEPENASHRQSLPSIKDVISGTKPPSFPPPPSSSLTSGPPGLPSPFPPSAIPPRSYPDGPQDRSSPRPLHPYLVPSSLRAFPTGRSCPTAASSWTATTASCTASCTGPLPSSVVG